MLQAEVSRAETDKIERKSQKRAILPLMMTMMMGVTTRKNGMETPIGLMMEMMERGMSRTRAQHI
jgi:hypothetical protein